MVTSNWLPNTHISVSDSPMWDTSVKANVSTHVGATNFVLECSVCSYPPVKEVRWHTGEHPISNSIVSKNKIVILNVTLEHFRAYKCSVLDVVLTQLKGKNIFRDFEIILSGNVLKFTYMYTTF